MNAVVLEILVCNDAIVCRHIGDDHLADASFVKHVRSFRSNRFQCTGVIGPDYGLANRGRLATRQKYFGACREHRQVFLVEADDVRKVLADGETALGVADCRLDYGI